MADHFIEKQLGFFSSGAPKTQHEAFRQLIAARKHNKAVKSEKFAFGLARLYEIAGDPSCDTLDRLLAVATLGRVASTIRSMRAEVHKRLESVLIELLPEPQLLDDVDDRAYIGKICAATLPKWTSIYAAKAVVIEETGEQARQAFMHALIKANPDLVSALEAMINQLQDYKPGTEDPGTSMAVKMRRIFAALRVAMAENTPEAGDNPGLAISRMIKAGFAGIAPPTKQEAVVALSEEVAGIVHEIVRLRFSMATEASTYQALLYIKEMVTSHTWERITPNSANLDKVATDITEALLILARQGIADTSLADRLATALGNRKRSRVRLAELAQKPGIPPDVKTWLVEGRISGPEIREQARGESQQLSDDVKLADLLVDAQRYQRAQAVCRQKIMPELEILTPGLVPELEKLMNYSLGLCDTICSLANGRGLRLRGTPGDEENYAPLEHESADGVGGIRRVRIIRPMVEQTRNNGTTFVVRKGIVEKIK